MKVKYKHAVNLEPVSTIMPTKNDTTRVVVYKGVMVATSVNKADCTIDTTIQIDHFYRPQNEVWEDIVFTGVSLSMGGDR